MIFRIIGARWGLSALVAIVLGLLITTIILSALDDDMGGVIVGAFGSVLMLDLLITSIREARR